MADQFRTVEIRSRHRSVQGMEELCYFDYEVKQRSQGIGENKLLIVLEFFKVKGVELSSRLPISVEEYSKIAEKGIGVHFSHIKQLSSSSSFNENVYARKLSESLSSMGVPHDLHPGVLQKLFAAVVAAVSANTIVVGVWDTTHLIGVDVGVGVGVDVGVDADGAVYGGDGEGDLYGGRADVFQYESSSRPKFNPASNSSIEGLEQVTLDITTITQTPSCVICLEDFAAFVDYQQKEPITRLPCGHHYHVHCIVQWLEFSHLCPLCRYPMPTEDDRSNCGGSEASIAR